MIRRTLAEVVSMTGAVRTTAGCDGRLSIHGVSIDSRTLRQGSLFVPIVRIDDGHRYVEQAFENGAAASLWQADHMPVPEGLPLIIVEDTLKALQLLAQSYREQLNCRVIGVTGSNGKTTVKDMIASLLGTTFKVHKTHGNLNGEYGLPLSLLDVEEDTEVVVLEMGMSHAGEMRTLSEIAKPDIGVITMIGVSHLSNLGSREGIARAKLELLEGLNPYGAFIIHGDEPLLAQPLSERRLPGTLAVIRFGESQANDYYLLTNSALPSGLSFATNRHQGEFKLPLLGTHNALNALAAIAVAELFQIGVRDIRIGLEQVDVTGMRMERLRAAGGFLMINDAWNASPVSMKAAIETVSKLNGFRKKVLVLGDMLELGEREMAFHEEIASCIEQSDIQAVLTIGAISHVITSKLAESGFAGVAEHFASKDELIAACRRLLDQDDVLLVKGSRSLKLEEICDSLLH